MRLYGETLADEFGGIWLEDAGQVMVVGFTRDAEAHATSLRGLVAGPLIVRTCRHALAELLELRDRIWADREKLLQRGVVVNGVGVGRQTVGVTVARLDPSVRALLDDRYGTAPLTLSAGEFVALPGRRSSSHRPPAAP